MKKTYHSAITGKFVSKEYAEENPDTTVELTNCNLRNELKEFQAYVIRFNKEIKDQSLVDQFLEDK